MLVKYCCSALHPEGDSQRMFSNDFLLPNLLGLMKWIWKLKSAQFEAILDPFFAEFIINKRFLGGICREIGFFGDLFLGNLLGSMTSKPNPIAIIILPNQAHRPSHHIYSREYFRGGPSRQ